MIDLFTSSFASLSNDELFSAISELAKNQPVETTHHDFKLLWNNETLKDVAAFANTLGGLLILGVEKNSKSLVANLSGIRVTGELVTGIANAIATNISPTPQCDIVECFEPSDREKRFCLIRIRSGPILHLLTKKDISHTVYVRNQDRTIPADGPQLRMLIDREKRAVVDLSNDRLARSSNLLGHLTVNLASRAQLTSAPSPTFFKIGLVPSYPKMITLDVSREQDFVQAIYRRYPQIYSCVSDAVAVEDIDRSVDFYEYRWFHQDLAYESLWRITDTLELAHAVQVRSNGLWSIVDIIAYTILMVALGSEWWKSNGFFGDGVMVAELRVPGLSLRLENERFKHNFDPGIGNFSFSNNILTLNPRARNNATSHVQVSFANMRNNLSSLVTTLLNQLIRSLGHGVRWEEFGAAVDAIVSRITKPDSVQTGPR
jgi:hypothetical protein